MKTYLYNTLENYNNNKIYPFHMPGHKGGKHIDLEQLIKMDYTEIEGLDNLQAPTGIIDQAQNRAAKLYHTNKTFFLVNGSTVGILAAILALTNKGDKILVARNCHKSVYNAILLNELHPIYVYPSYVKQFNISGGISVLDIKSVLEQNSDIKVVIITSPTYEGVVSDIEAITCEVHQYGIPLIVDEAHGAHFKFHSTLPKSALECGADLVIHSLHKTLPALTQTALLHVNSSMIKQENIQLYLNILQTSSPSYVLMASIDYCLGVIESQGQRLFNTYIEKLIKLRKALSGLSIFELVDKDIVGEYHIIDYDISKIVLSIRQANITIEKIKEMLLYKYKLQMELFNKAYFLGMTSVSDTEDGYKRLIEALLEIEGSLKKKLSFDDTIDNILIRPEFRITPSKAGKSPFKQINLDKSEGSISLEFVIPYPPGIPLIVPGEIMNQSVLQAINEYIRSGVSIIGLEDPTLQTIKVVNEVSK